MDHTLTQLCPTARKMVYSCPMHMTRLPGSNQPSAWTKALHLFYAGLFALVLPLICWGAQATPGHPHARAHFVFVDPILVGEAHANVADLPPHTDGAAHHAHPLPSSKLPAGRSTPSMLGITLLTLVVMGAVVGPFWNPSPSFSCWLAPLWVMPLTIVIPTPPPR